MVLHGPYLMNFRHASMVPNLSIQNKILALALMNNFLLISDHARALKMFSNWQWLYFHSTTKSSEIDKRSKEIVAKRSHRHYSRSLHKCMQTRINRLMEIAWHAIPLSSSHRIFRQSNDLRQNNYLWSAVLLSTLSSNSRLGNIVVTCVLFH